MEKIKCVRDIYGNLVPIDKISFISKDYWVFADGCRYDISYETHELLLSIFEVEEKKED